MTHAPGSASSAQAVAEQRGAPQHHYLGALTGMRAFAALSVYLSHLPVPDGVPGAAARFMASGYGGVTIFFVLSGFVLTLRHAGELSPRSPTDLWNFFIARFARIYPLYLVVLLWVATDGRPAGDPWLLHALALQTWSSDLHHAFTLNAPGWSISVEFFLYACFPLLLPLVSRLRSLRAVITGLAVVSVGMLALAAWFHLVGRGDLPSTDPGSAHRWLYRTPLTRLGDFVLGMLAAQLHFLWRASGRSVRMAPVAAGGAALALLAVMIWPGENNAWRWDVAFALPATMLILALALAPRAGLAWLLSRPLLVLLGEASFAFYLLHYPLIAKLGADEWATRGLSLSSTVSQLLTLGLIVAASLGAHLLLERPARMRIRRLLVRRSESTRDCGSCRQHAASTASALRRR